MRVDFALVLYWGSLGISAAAVVLFLWLMREKRDTGLGTGNSKQNPTGASESRVPSPESRVKN